MRRIGLAALLVVAVILGIYLGNMKAEQETLTKGPLLSVEFLDAEHGSATIVETPENEFILIDPGPSASAENLLNYLEDKHVRTVTLVVTHPSSEHIGSAESIIDSLQVKRLIHSPLEVESPSWNRLVNRAEVAKIQKKIVSEGDVVKFSGGVELEVLSPPKELLETRSGSRDNNSLITRLRYGKKSFLLASRSRTEAEAYLIGSGKDIAASVLVLSRHTQTDATSLEWLACVRPSFCILLADSVIKQPHHRLMERISPENTGAALYRTDRDGIIQMLTDGVEIRIRTTGNRQLQ